MSMSIAHQVAERMNMLPCMIAKSHLMAAAADLKTLAAADSTREMEKAQVAKNDMLAAFGFSRSSPADKPYAFANGIAFIPVTGVLINRFGWSWGGYVTGYNYIRSMLNMALADPDVDRIVFDVNSYGGEVAGCFELVDDIYEARGQKPMLAVIDSNCYSAGYAVASAADRRVITPSGGAGSIGVVCTHVSYEKMLQDWGLEFTLIASGEHKTDGNPYEALSDDVKADIKDRVHKSRVTFAEKVARNLGIEFDAVMATEAQCYRAEDALKIGLVDAVQPPSKAVQAFLNELSGSDDDHEEENDMTAETKPEGKEKVTAPVADQAAIAQAAADARKAERERVSAIISLPEAANRKAQANHIAMNTDMSVEDAKVMLAASAEDKAVESEKKNPFDDKMDNSEHPKVGADTGNTGDDKELDGGDRILADAKAAGLNLG